MKEQSKNEDTYNRKNDDKILRVRRLLQSTKYLGSPMESKPFMDIEKKIPLSGDILNLKNIAKDNFDRYVEAKSKGETVKLKLVFATEQEKIESEKVENKTKEEIKVLIFEKISELNAEQQSLHQEIYTKNIKNKKKQSFINYYNELCEVIEQYQSED